MSSLFRWLPSETHHRPTRVNQLVVQRNEVEDRDDLMLVLGRAPPGGSAEIIRVLEGLPFVLRVSENAPEAGVD